MYTTPGKLYPIPSTIDFCPPSRLCSGNGVCNDNTGICECVGDWWGVDCETPCVCENGGICVDAYCRCPFPWWGQRCNKESECTTCGI